MSTETPEVVIGYKYYMGMHLVICHGPVTEVLEMRMGDRLAAWANPSDYATAEGGNRSVTVDKPELFGGERKEGGIQGELDLLFGFPDQPKNDYLVEQLGEDVPAFRGVVSMVLKKMYLSALTPYIKPISFVVKNLPKFGTLLYDFEPSVKQAANPIAIIYDLLTNSTYGLGYPKSAINVSNFQTVAGQCEFGLNFLFSSQDSVESMISMILGHINGILYIEPDSGKFAVKLIRDDYDVGSLIVFDESNVTSLDSYERPSYADIVNEIIIIYRPIGTDKDDSVTVQNLGLIQAQQGVVSQTINYPGIGTKDDANRVAIRDLQQKSTPVARIKLTTMRHAWNMTIGDVFKFSWARLGISGRIYRIISISYGTLNNGEITIDAIEDIFGLPESSDTYSGNQTSGWIDPTQPPETAQNVNILEATYWDIVRTVGAEDKKYLDDDSCFVQTVVGYQSYYSSDYEFWAKLNSPSVPFHIASNGVYSPSGLLSVDIDETDTEFTLVNRKGMLAPLKMGAYAMIENEIVRLDAFNKTTGVVTVGRGCLDTVAKKHLEGSVFYFSDIYKVFDRTEYATGDQVAVKVFVHSGGQIQNINDPTVASGLITMVGRYSKPYPPGNFKVNGSFYPVNIAETDITVSWSHRDKTVQTSTIVDHTAGNIGPETGVTYTLRFYGEDGSLRKTVSGLTGTSYTWATEIADSGFSPPRYNTAVRIELEAVKGGNVSYQKHSHQCYRP